MGIEGHKDLYVLAFNHKNISEKERSDIYLSESLKTDIYKKCSEENIDDLCIISTCNRTEIYGYGNSDHTKSILFEEVKEISAVKEHMMELHNNDAMKHLFHVASGLDSQIIGDLEILNQFKNAFRNAKANDLLSGYMERLANTCLQSAKEIRSNTKLTSGTTSYSYAVIKLLKELLKESDKKILVVGTGELGKSVIKNIKEYLPQHHLTITNRTNSNSIKVSEQIDCSYILFEDLDQNLSNFDVIVTAIANAKEPVIKSDRIGDLNNKIFIDLSVPLAIDKTIKEDNESIFFSIDSLSKVINETLEERRKYIPLAEKIILKYIHEFSEWSKIYAQSNNLKKWKDIVNDIASNCTHFKDMNELQMNSILKKSVANFALFIKNNSENANDENMLKNFLQSKNENCCHLNENNKTISKECFKCLRP